MSLCNSCAYEDQCFIRALTGKDAEFCLAYHCDSPPVFKNVKEPKDVEWPEVKPKVAGVRPEQINPLTWRHYNDDPK